MYRRPNRFSVIAAITLWPAFSAQAAPVVLATQPLVTASTSSVAPNVLLMMDDSGSMAWSHMPDSNDDNNKMPMQYGYYGFRSSQCNGMAYNPTIAYLAPVDATGASYPNASFTAAWVDGYKVSSGTVNLSSSYKATDSGGINNQDTTGAAAYYYKYSGSQTKKTYYDASSTFFSECSAAQTGSAPNYNIPIFTRVTVSATSGPGGIDERTNFANWYSYYRTRILMMKTSTGLAFKGLGSNYRVGFATMNNNGGNKFLNLASFDATQKAAWYTMLYSTSANNSTPLLKALSNAGLLYANRLPGNKLNGVAVIDPIQYSCQQNFTVLTTDGFWNVAGTSDLFGNPVGNQDGNEQRPMLDSLQQIKTEKTPTTTTNNYTWEKINTAAVQYKSTYSYLGATGADGCSASKRKRHDQVLICKKTTVTPSTAPQAETIVDTTTVVTTNGVAAPPTTTTSTTNSPSSPSYTTGSATATYNPVGCDPSSPLNTTWTISSDAATGSCATSPSLPGTNPSTPSTTTLSNSTSTPTKTLVSTVGPTTGATTVTTTTSGGTSDTLADVAEYYYKTDLRDAALGNAIGSLGADVAQNNVPGSGLDGASWQHMTTFTLGLGAPGKMQFSPTYMTDRVGDFYAVRKGATATSTTCTWQSPGTECNWPVPSVSGIPANIDDLWHAAVNGRGTYFSATDPAELTIGLTSALSGVSARLGAAAAATTSNPNVTAGDNFVFESSFTAGEWTGELARRTLNLMTGRPGAATDWSVNTLLDIQSARTIYTWSSSGPGHLKSFAWGSLTAAEQNYFKLPWISTLSQFCTLGSTCLTSADQALAEGENLVKFLEGDTTNAMAYYRNRAHILGDVVSAEAAYVRTPAPQYGDPGFSAFKSGAVVSGRAGMVYTASNDGMLHAFVAGGAKLTSGDGAGSELWAYVPALVLPNLYKLADTDYRNKHQFYLDGTPVTGDICPTPPCSGTDWKTILVAGMNAGGRGYYALDITDPAHPKAMWEFTDTNMGYTYGNPEIAKLKNGTWVVLVASGYNNITPGDGVGRLYILNAYTGALIRTISTGAGTTSTPSGLARIRAWLQEGNTDATALRVYGGDLLGNVWRFDINDIPGLGVTGYDAQLLVTLKDASSNIQPITARPAIELCGNTPMVIVGTGQYLGYPDLASTNQQSLYGIKDTLGATTFSTSPQTSGSGFQKQTITSTTCPDDAPTSICTVGQSVRVGSSNTVNLATQNGWYLNFLDTGERDNTDPSVAFGTLVMNTNIPNTDACNIGGYSFNYALNACSGAPIATAKDVVAISLGNAIATRPQVVVLPNGTVVALTRMSDGSTVVTNPPNQAPPGSIRRVSWRELRNDQ